jgi:hypothetical protein
MEELAMSYGQYARIYRDLGMWPRPVKPGTKACKERDWQLPDNEQSPHTLQKWLDKCAPLGIGLLMGSPMPDGTRLGALDIDRNEYTALGRTLLNNPICGRVGEKGAVFFVRVIGDLGNPEFRVRGPDGKKWGKVAECLFRKKLCVIPPTIHPNTQRSYQWIGTPLHDVDLSSLPVIGE